MAAFFYVLAAIFGLGFAISFFDMVSTNQSLLPYEFAGSFIQAAGCFSAAITLAFFGYVCDQLSEILKVLRDSSGAIQVDSETTPETNEAKQNVFYDASGKIVVETAEGQRRFSSMDDVDRYLKKGNN